jgi:molybdenum cofactor synthesis domain-containing protein
VVADEAKEISAILIELASEARLVVTTGGTGFGPRDVTPEATSAVLDRTAPGLMHLLFAKGLESTPMAVLSRGVVGNRGRALIVNLPGNPRAVEEGMAALLPVLGHALELLEGNTGH